MEPLGPRAVRQELHRAGGLAARDPERGGEVWRVEPEDEPGGRRRAEGAAGAGRVKAAAVVGGGAERHGESRGHLVSRDRGVEDRPAAGAGQLGRGERGREDARAEVDRAALVGVVHLERVRGCAVGERRMRRRETLGRTEHGRVSTRAEPAEASPQHDARLLARTAARHAEVVAEEVARPLEDGARQLGTADGPDLVREALGERRVAHGRLRLPIVRAANASIAARVSGVRHTAQIGSSPLARAAAMRASPSARSARLLAAKAAGGRAASSPASASARGRRSAAGTTSSTRRRTRASSGEYVRPWNSSSGRYGPPHEKRTTSSAEVGKGTPTWISV